MGEIHLESVTQPKWRQWRLLFEPIRSRVHNLPQDSLILAFGGFLNGFFRS